LCPLVTELAVSGMPVTVRLAGYLPLEAQRAGKRVLKPSLQPNDWLLS